MSILEDKARLIADDLVANQAVPTDTAAASDFLQWLMDLFKELIPTLMGCFGSTEKAVKAINNPDFFQRFRLRSFLRKKMRDDDMERRMLSPMERSMLKLGATITKDEYVAMTQAV